MCVAAAIGGAALAGGVISAVGAESAANTQAGAAQNAQNLQQQNFNTQLANEAPYRQAGSEAQQQLNYLEGIGPNSGGTPGGGGYGSLNAPFTASMMKQYSPAYQFQMQQGQQGVLNADSSGQGALSGAALKDLTSFNQNYANTAFNNAFNQYQTQNSNIYGRLAGIANTGEAAASNQATGGSSYSQGIGQSAQNVGTALAGGTIGATNALSGGIQGAALYGALSNTAAGGNPYNYNQNQMNLSGGTSGDLTYAQQVAAGF
jgi:hypothetical protein